MKCASYLPDFTQSLESDNLLCEQQQAASMVRLYFSKDSDFLNVSNGTLMRNGQRHVTVLVVSGTV
jgi:hypothetical protein